ncbi:hypothetical protein [Paraburkholderia hospita]|jgi:hypothetical protein|uniref:Uncharacterized protein n=1 Tax=Paraburkholderia hospita TaxID=169430 RepID=A0ABN0FLK3_9BURK|nr:hypothetical protein [Paraburkholderia hospita]EIM99624.1 hypothetical protein WQE_18119 [Paraburkholderia hospita]
MLDDLDVFTTDSGKDESTKPGTERSNSSGKTSTSRKIEHMPSRRVNDWSADDAASVGHLSGERCG